MPFKPPPLSTEQSPPSCISYSLDFQCGGSDRVWMEVPVWRFQWGRRFQRGGSRSLPSNPVWKYVPKVQTGLGASFRTAGYINLKKCQ